MKKTIYILIGSIILLASFKAADDYFEVSKNLDIFASVYKEVNTSYVDDVKPGELIRAAIDGMLSSLDPYTNFYSEAQAEDFNYQVTGSYAGIGATIRKVGDYVVIDSPYEGFPAEKSGLLPGDKILSIDGKSMINKSTAEVTTFLKGNAGSTLIINIEKADGSKKEMSIERAQIKLNNVPYFGMIDDKVGYIKLTGFTQGASTEVRDAVIQLKSSGAKNLILDLRGNGGGLLHEAVNIVNIFVKRGETIVVTKGKEIEENRQYKTLNVAIDTDIPLIVFIDERSASASEIVSGALQDLDRALLIGRNSFGKGLVQGTKRLSYNSQMKITIAKYYIPSGRLIQRLDYASKVNGRATAVADSLKQTFYTRNKRPVSDGEGIYPDVKVDMAPYSRVAESLIRNNHLFNFAALYRMKNLSIVSPKDFDVSESLYNEFKAYLSDKDYHYKTETENELERLKEKAKNEKLSESIAQSIALLEKDIEEHKENDLEFNKPEIKELLEYEITRSYYFEQAKVEVSFDDDPDLAKAMEFFMYPTKIQETLGY